MGHKVNPLVFRLGISNDWESSLKEPKNWMVSYLIYQLVSKQFMNYTTPHFNHKKRRNSRNAQGLVIMKGEKQTVGNPLKKRSILLSHVNCGSQNSKMTVTCNFYDYKLYYKRYNYRYKRFRKYNQLFSNSPLRRYIRYPYWRKQIKHRTYPWRFKRWIKNLGASPWLYNFRIRNYTIARSVNPTANCLKLNSCWLRLSSKIHLFNKTKKIFFITVWINLLLGLFSILKKAGYRTMAKRLYIVLQILNLAIYSFKIKNYKFFNMMFLQRYYLFKAFSRTLNNSIKSMIPSIDKVNTIFNAMKEKEVRSSLLTNLIIVKLEQYYTINSIVFPITNWLKRHNNVLGFRIIVSGRLTRRERASHIIKSYKAMPLSSYEHRVDYHQDIKIMKFGMVGIKIYLFVKPRNRYHYYWLKFSHN